MRGLLLDIAPLQVPTYRRLWLGRSVSLLGGQLTVVAVMYQVWALTHSPAWSGSVAAVQAVPMIVVGLWGGALVDRVDRRRVLLVTVVGQLVCSAGLAAQALWFPSVAVVLPVVAAQTSFMAVGAPAFRTVTPRLLPARKLAAGLALTRISGQLAMLAGPAVGGLLIGYAGLRACYLIDAASFTAALYGIAGLPSMPPEGGSAGRGLAAIVEGLHFVATHPVVRGVMLADLAATLLAMPVSLFPVINQERFGGDPRTLGLFLSAIAVGGVVASAFAGSFTRRTRLGVVMIGGAVAWGASLTLFGLVAAAWPSLVFLALAGAADTVSVVSRSTVIQLVVPDRLRGRASSVELIVGIAGPDLGNLRAGAVAQWTSGAVACVSGGLTCLAALAVVVPTCPGLAGYRSGPALAPSRRRADLH